MKELWGKIEFTKEELSKTNPYSFISYLIRQHERVMSETYRMNKVLEKLRKLLKSE